MGGDSSRTTQTSSSTSAPSWALPGLERANSEALRLYNQGTGTERYPGSLVIPYANQTTQGMEDIQRFAGSAQPTIEGQFQRVANNAAFGGLNPLQQQSIDYLQPMAAGDQLVQNNPFTDAVENLVQNNPFTDAVVNRNADVMGNAVNEAFSNQAYQQDYNRERGYQQDAIGSLFEGGQQQQQNLGANTGMLSNAYGAALQPASSMMDVGGRYEDLATRLKADELRLIEDPGQAQWDNLLRLAGVAGGAGQFKDTTQTVLGPQTSGGIQGGIGGAIAGAGLGLGPLGVLGGGLLGLIG
jgi:hypothetical protein